MNTRRQMIIAAGAAVLVTLLFFFFVLSPKLGQIAETREAVEAARAEEGHLRSELARLRDAKAAATDTRARLATVEQFLPSSPDLPGFIRLVQDAATKAGIDLASIAPGEPTELENARGIDVITVTLTLTGGFRRVEDFLARLESLDRVVEVRSLTLAPAEESLTDQTVLGGTLGLSMYVVQPDARLEAGSRDRGTTEQQPAAEETS